jgi:hypothetical protein
MPSRTLEDKVEDLTKLTAAHTEQLQNLRESLKDAGANHTKTANALNDLKNVVVRLEQQLVELNKWKEELGFLTDLRTDVAILRRDVDKLEKTKEEWSRRLWAMAGPIVGAVVGVLLGYFLRR